jgi:glycosyltransferase involved in cell wall biosynthesis
MKIGFDVSQTGQFKTGCGYFADALARELVAANPDDSFILYPTFGAGYWDSDWPRSTLRLTSPNATRAPGQARLDLLEAFWLEPSPAQEAQLGWPDVIHSNNFFCPTTLQRARLVYTLHDLAFMAHPEWTTEANWQVCFEGVFNASLYADHVIAVSEFTRRCFLASFPYVPESRVSVVREASRFQRKLGGPAPRELAHLRPRQFWLASGDTGARKNLSRLLEAYARLRTNRETSFPLVLFGGAGDGSDVGVERLGYVNDVSLQWLYENCFAFCYPSLYEGFGLPVIEAMSLGAPVLSSNVTSLPEVVGESGLLIDPFDIESIAAAMRRLLREPTLRLELRDAALDQSQRFSWQTAAAQVREVYASVLTEYPRSSAA